MDELYEVTMELERVRAERDSCRAELDAVHKRNILLEAENHRLKQLLECSGVWPTA